MNVDGRTTRIRALHRLSALRVAKAKTPGFQEDGGGLRLIISDKGVKRWSLRLTLRRIERGLGIWPAVNLEQARRKAEAYRQAARQGRDARFEEKQDLRRRIVRFKDAFEAFFEMRRCQLSNGKHMQQWQNTMRDYVFPVIGERPVGEIMAADVIEVLKPIWFSKPETATRVLQRMNATFDSAILRGTREKANPCIGVTRELGTNNRRVSHHPALAWRSIPAFVRSLRARDCLPATRPLLEFLILTAARSGEARGALWAEIDLARRVWTIPGLDPVTGRRTKTRRPHVVPLSRVRRQVFATGWGFWGREALARLRFQIRRLFAGAAIVSF